MKNKFFTGLKKLLTGTWRLLANNLGLKIAAVAFAIILWAFVMVEINPPREKEFSSIDLIFENSSMLAEKDLTIKDNFEDILAQVEITVEANPDYLYLITEDNIKAYVDLSIVNKPGEQVVAIKATTSIGTIVGIKPKTVTLNVEDNITRIVPITYEIKNAPTDYYVAEPVFTPEQIEIHGARSFVEKVASAVCYIDLHGVTEDLKESIPLVLRDDEGEAVAVEAYSEDLPSVIVDLAVKPQKQVPINLEGAIIGLDDVAEGFIVTDYYIEPASVLVAAEQSILDTILEVQVESVDISGAKSDLAIQTNVKPIDDAIITKSTQSIVINVVVAALETTQMFEAVNVVAEGLAEGLDATVVPQTIRVVITDEQLAVEELEIDDILLFVDAEGLEAGEYTLPIQFAPLNGIDPDNVWLSIQRAKLVISKKN